MLEKITQALISAYKRDHEGAGDNIMVEADEEKGEVRMYVKKDVVETVDNPYTEVSLADARQRLPHIRLGDVVRVEVKTKDFGRIAAQTARQVIIQGMREAERGMIYDEFSSKEHELLTGVVTRIDPRSGSASLRLSLIHISVISIPLWAMALIGLAGLALFLVSMKYGDRWEARLLEKFKQ